METLYVFILCHNGFKFQHTTQLTFTCSKLTIETLEKGVKYVES